MPVRACGRRQTLVSGSTVENGFSTEAGHETEDSTMRRPIAATILAVVASLAIASSARAHKFVNASGNVGLDASECKGS
jgi:hypothetical protein